MHTNFLRRDVKLRGEFQIVLHETTLYVELMSQDFWKETLIELLAFSNFELIHR